MTGKIAEAKTKRGRSYSGSDLSGEYIDPHSCGDGTLNSESTFSPDGHVKVSDLSKSKMAKRNHTCQTSVKDLGGFEIRMRRVALCCICHLHQMYLQLQ